MLRERQESCIEMHEYYDLVKLFDILLEPPSQMTDFVSVIAQCYGVP